MKLHPIFSGFYGICLSIIIVGVTYTGYMAFIDGHYVRPAIVFHNDLQNIKTDKTAYHKGDVVKGYFDFCQSHLSGDGLRSRLLSLCTDPALLADVGLTPGTSPQEFSTRSMRSIIN